MLDPDLGTANAVCILFIILPQFMCNVSLVGSLLIRCRSSCTGCQEGQMVASVIKGLL